MARTKRDDMKRSIGQAVNHMAQAILDINAVFEQFEESVTEAERAKAAQEIKTAKDKKGVDVVIETEADKAIREAAEKSLDANKKYCEYLKAVMISIAQDREAVLSFALSAWNIDEDRLMSYTV